MKVIRRSNYDHEDWRGDERLMKDGLTLEEAEAHADALNSSPDRSDEDWFVVVDDDHVLSRFEP